MKNTLTAGAALLLTTTAAHAVGLDRSAQSVSVLFEEGGETGSYAELSYGYVMPDINAAYLDALGGAEIDDVAEDFSQLGFGYKRDLDAGWSIALIIDEPYGANIQYPDGLVPAVLSDVSAELDSLSVTAIGRYKFNENFSAYAGPRAQRIEASIVLPNGGTTVDLDESTAYGYLVGAAYERPEIALRVALTYFSEIEHTFDTTTAGVVEEELDVKTPQAVNLDFQTGIAADTLLFGSIRWAEYEVVEVIPTPVGVSITDIDTGTSYSLGVGRRFSDQFSASLVGTFDTEGDDDLVSPLGPTNGSYSVGVGGQYKVNDNVTLSGGVRYINFGDATIAPGGTEVASAEDNSAIAVGFKVGYNF